MGSKKRTDNWFEESSVIKFSCYNLCSCDSYSFGIIQLQRNKNTAGDVQQEKNKYAVGMMLKCLNLSKNSYALVCSMGNNYTSFAFHEW